MSERTLEQSWERYYSGDEQWADLRERFHWMRGRVVGPDVLDAGCGGGLLGSLLAARDDIRLIAGVDDYGPAIRAAREHVAEREPRWREKMVFLCLDAVHLPFPDGGFDTAVAGELLEHVADPGAVLTELARVTRPGGRLVVTVPHGGEATKEHVRVFGGDSFWSLMQGRCKTVLEFGSLARWLVFCGEGIR